MEENPEPAATEEWMREELRRWLSDAYGTAWDDQEPRITGNDIDDIAWIEKNLRRRWASEGTESHE